MACKAPIHWLKYTTHIISANQGNKRRNLMRNKILNSEVYLPLHTSKLIYGLSLYSKIRWTKNARNSRHSKNKINFCNFSTTVELLITSAQDNSWNGKFSICKPAQCSDKNLWHLKSHKCWQLSNQSLQTKSWSKLKN